MEFAISEHVKPFHSSGSTLHSYTIGNCRFSFTIVKVFFYDVKMYSSTVISNHFNQSQFDSSCSPILNGGHVNGGSSTAIN